MTFQQPTLGFFTALCVGFLIGMVRERLHQPGVMMAGVRTHTIAALMGAVAFNLGLPVFIIAMGMTGILIAVGYFRSYGTDPGMTGEVSLALTVLLGGLAISSHQLAAALGVTVAVLLFLKKPLRKFSQELLTEKELEDALILFAAALVVLPLLPQEAIDPWGGLKPFAIWKVVVIIMCTGMLGHLAIRLTGLKWGLPITGFLSGFISSTAVIMDLGQKSKKDPAITAIACASALLSTLASLMLFALVLGASSFDLLKSVALPLMMGGLSLLAMSVLLFKRHPLPSELTLTATQDAFQLKHVFIIAFSISSISLASSWIGYVFGQTGTLISAVIIGFAEIHAAAFSISQLERQSPELAQLARWGVIGILTASVISKSVLSVVGGGKDYGFKMASALVVFITVTGIGLLF
ncbi:MAG: hypothetical protein RLZZ433_2365 [Pseudomonadota bacterium]|jgi:uncharacterized membrane protein (DUF4010 family)